MFAQKGFWLGLEWRDEEEGLSPKENKKMRDEKFIGERQTKICNWKPDRTFTDDSTGDFCWGIIRHLPMTERKTRCLPTPKQWRLPTP